MATKGMSKTTRSVKQPVENIESAVTEKPVAAENVKKHEFKEHDPVKTVSCTSGELLAEGQRSKILYSWAGLGESIDVEYGDLMAMIHSRSPYVFKPRFIIQDQDFLAENPNIAKLYENLYTVDDFREILQLPANRLTDTLKRLPIGVQDAIKGLAAGMIDSHELDSINTIKALDAFYGTNMLLKLTEVE